MAAKKEARNRLIYWRLPLGVRVSFSRIRVAAVQAAAGEQTAEGRTAFAAAEEVRAAAHFERAVARKLRLKALDDRHSAVAARARRRPTGTSAGLGVV